jgi:hypothetical protein
MYYLNRLRGTYSWFAKIVAIFLGVVFGLTTSNPYIGVAVAVGYLAGESIGWGTQLGGQIRRIADMATQYDADGGYDGSKYGIHQMALWFSKIDTDDYYVTWLFIRGLYWWTLTFVSLYWVLDPLLVTITILFLASWFPLSVLMAESNDQHWKSAENIYGLAQNVGIGVLLIGILLL